MNILMVAAENDALPGGKIGGIGDVVRDIPPALAALGASVAVVIPGYQYFSTLPGSEKVATFNFKFGGNITEGTLYRVGVVATSDSAGSREGKVTQWVIEHPALAPAGAGKIYCDDPPSRPFATDASKFALFCTAVATAVERKLFGELDVIHLHDWHAALIALLRAKHPAFTSLQKIHTVYTIHNLSLQGIRPIAGDASSLRSWFPELDLLDPMARDPRYIDCVNPMRIGLNFSDKVHAVSPHYAKEIIQPTDAAVGFIGGEGLEIDLQHIARQGRLLGILNGADYDVSPAPKLPHGALFKQAKKALQKWQTNQPSELHHIADERLDSWLNNPKESLLLTSVGRVTHQKMGILLQPIQGTTVLEKMLKIVPTSGRLLMLGSGDSTLENQLGEIAKKHPNFCFLRGYSDPLSQALFSTGDLFIMPSSFEPCGISQMLAMRAGQPCLVHAVGGLVDTVKDDVTGFSFSGTTPEQQGENLITRFQQVIAVWNDQPEQYSAIREAAAAARFLWRDAASGYLGGLYCKFRQFHTPHPKA